MSSNELYLVVLPLIHLGTSEFGRTEQVLTVLPGRDLATEFFPEEVDGFVATFRNRLNLLTGGHVTGYEIQSEATSNGRVVVRVIQNVR